RTCILRREIWSEATARLLPVACSNLQPTASGGVDRTCGQHNTGSRPLLYPTGGRVPLARVERARTGMLLQRLGVLKLTEVTWGRYTFLDRGDGLGAL